jgi:hypothetical protein
MGRGIPMTTKQCPFCAEDIQEGAKVCRHCGGGLLQLRPPPKGIGQEIKELPSSSQGYVLVLIGVLFVSILIALVVVLLSYITPV